MSEYNPPRPLPPLPPVFNENYFFPYGAGGGVSVIGMDGAQGPTGPTGGGFNITDAYQALGSQIKGVNMMIPFVAYIVDTAVALADTTFYSTAIYLPIAQTLTGVFFLQAVQGVYTAADENRVGLYSYSGGTITLIASSANNGNLWKNANNTWNKEPFSVPISVAAGLYFVGGTYNNSAQTTAPRLGASLTSLALTSLTMDFTNNARLSASGVGFTNLPSSVVLGGLANAQPRYFSVY